MSRDAHLKRWEARRVPGISTNCRRAYALAVQCRTNGAPAGPEPWPALFLLCQARLPFDPLRQLLVSRRNFLHRLPGLRVAHRLGLGEDFLRPCSPAADEQCKLGVWRNLAISAFDRPH